MNTPPTVETLSRLEIEIVRTYNGLEWLADVESERLPCGTLVVEAYHCEWGKSVYTFVVPFGVPRPNVGAFVASVYRQWWQNMVRAGKDIREAKEFAATHRPCRVIFTTVDGHLSFNEELL